MADQSLGGRYSAKTNADGTLDIFDVPIVSELDKGERADLPEFEITPKWLAAALKRATARAARGYLPPIHIHHHDDGPPKERAGFFRIKRVGDFDLAGKPVKTLFADLLRIPKAVAEKILSGELPYRSIEILNVNSEPEVDSLALLDSQPPQFRYPLLSIGRMIAAAGSSNPLAARAIPTAAVAFAASPKKNAAAILFNFPGEPPMDDANPVVDQDPEVQNLEAAEGPLTCAAFEAAMSKLTAALTASFDGSLSKHFEAFGQKMQAGAAPVAAPADASMAKEEPDGDEEKMNAAKDEEDAGAAKPKFVDPTTESSIVAKAVKAVKAEFAGVLAESKGEIQGLKAAAAARDKKDAEKDKNSKKVESLRAARASLRGAHIELTEEVEADLKAMADAGDEPLKRYVAGVVRSAPRDPESFDALSANFSASNDPAELAEFQNSPAKLTVARELTKQFNAMAARGYAPRGVDLKRFIDMNRGAFAGAVD